MCERNGGNRLILNLSSTRPSNINTRTRDATDRHLRSDLTGIALPKCQSTASIGDVIDPFLVNPSVPQPPLRTSSAYDWTKCDYIMIGGCH
jgi:hypothetical protein